MRHHAGAMNRTWLIIIGVLLLAAGTASILFSTGLMDQLSGGSLAGAEDPVLTDGPGVLETVPAAAVLIGGLILGLLGLWWMLAEVPRRRTAATYRLHEDAARGITRCDPAVLAAAVEDDAGSLPGVVSSTALLRGTAESPDLAMRLTLNERADVQEALRRVRTDVLANLSRALEVPLHTAGISLDVSRRPAQLGNTVESTGTVVY
ncbi:MAG: alkaline shock response membrane anchor protein AmaP [Arthrobacter sp.]